MNPPPLVLFINLDASADRRAYIEAALRATGFACERVAGIVGAALPAALKPYFCDPDGRIATPLTLGEIGCHAAHLAACRHFLASTAEVALVLEDDAQLPADLAAVLAATLVTLPPDWEIVRLSNSPKRACVPVAPLDGRYRLVKYSSVPGRSTAAYLINVAGAQKLTAPGLRRHAIDNHLRRPWLTGLRTYGVVPPPIRIAGFPSDIDAVQRRGQHRQAGFRLLGRTDVNHWPARLVFDIRWLGLSNWLRCLLANATRRHAGGPGSIVPGPAAQRLPPG